MKKFSILRHAKSEYQFGVKDIDRELNERGLNDCKLIGNWLKANTEKPDLILCSTATRTRMTLDNILNQTTWDSKVEYVKELYLPSLIDIFELMRHQVEETKHILIIGHNFGFTDLYNHLSLNRLDNLPTCGFAQFSINKAWNELPLHKYKQLYFKTPKHLK